MNLNLSGRIRDAILGNLTVVALLGEYEGQPAVHTRRPVPESSTYPMVVISTVDVDDRDMIALQMPIVTVDILIYGQQPDQYRAVEEIGYNLREQFRA